MNQEDLTQGRLLFQAANFPKAYHTRGGQFIVEFGTTRILAGASDPVDASALCWAMNNVGELISKYEELRK